MSFNYYYCIKVPGISHNMLIGEYSRRDAYLDHIYMGVMESTKISPICRYADKIEIDDVLPLIGV